MEKNQIRRRGTRKSQVITSTSFKLNFRIFKATPIDKEAYKSFIVWSKKTKRFKVKRKIVPTLDRFHPGTKQARLVLEANGKRRWMIKSRGRLREYNKLWKHKVRDDVLCHYGGKCVCCGESNFAFLVVDHINGGGVKHRNKLKRWGTGFLSWVKQNNYPEYLQILCANCNMAKAHLGKCPHTLQLSKG